MSTFVHLHNHTHYSLLDAACTPEQLVKAAVAQEHRAVALTDHGVMFGAVEFYKKAKKAGVKPIIGCEVYVANGSRHDKSLGKGPTKKKNYFHLVLLAKNNAGYQNLIKLVSLGHTEGYYYKPRIDMEILAKHTEGLFALSACLGGVINSHFLANDYDTARDTANTFVNMFGESFYLEVQDHTMPEDVVAMRETVRLAEELSIPMVGTNDCHYIKKEHAVAHNVFLLIKDVSAANSGKVNIQDLRYRVREFYYKTTDEMTALLGHIPGAIENTVAIAEQCDFTLDGSLRMPVFPIPEQAKSDTLDDYLVEITYEGLRRRYGPELPAEVVDRAEYELGVIKKMGFPGYFLIVQDFIRAARDMGVSVGPGRGSAAGSLVAYALKITNVDPLKYDLLFERFLNPERVSMPDIDIDFNDEKREQVIEWVRQKYGHDSVAQIITFGTLSTRAVIKDVGRVLGVPLSTIGQITEVIPVEFGKVKPLKEALDLPELRWIKDTPDDKIKQLIEYSLVLEGFARNSSLHAAGVVIAPGDISNYVPVYKTPSSEAATQYNMKDLEDAGLLKMDFLGLRTLSIIDNTLEMVRQNHGLEIDIDGIDLFDKKTFDLLGDGRTLAVFQFESEPMQKSLKMLKPTSLEDLTAMNALYRPGPMENIPEFVDRKHGKKEITYLHPLMESSLRNTYGIIVYQEQVMQLVRDIAGFSLAQADLMRRAMGKKDDKLMAEQRDSFVAGARKNDIKDDLAGEIFDLIQKFAKYGFNKSHALAYSYLAFQTAWLKTHYTSEFLAANMTAEMNNLDKVVQLIDEAKFFGIEVLPPDVNSSLDNFTAVDSRTIRFGLAAIKGLGRGPVESILLARKEKPFTSFFDFCCRVDTRVINRKALEALVCAGGFDSLRAGHRAQLFAAIEEGVKYAQAVDASQNAQMDSLFGDEMGAAPKEPALMEMTPWDTMERLKREKEVLNFYVSGHPLEQWRPYVTSFSTLMLGDKESTKIGKTVRCCGIVTGIRKKLDKRENTIAFVTIEDFTGKAEVIFWSEAFQIYGSMLQEDAILLFSGKSEISGSDSLKIVADSVLPIESAPETFTKGAYLMVQRDKTTKEDIQKAADLLMNGRDGGRIIFAVYAEGPQPVRRLESETMKLPLTHDKAQQLLEIFGRSNVRFLTE